MNTKKRIMSDVVIRKKPTVAKEASIKSAPEIKKEKTPPAKSSFGKSASSKNFIARSPRSPFVEKPFKISQFRFKKYFIIAGALVFIGAGVFVLGYLSSVSVEVIPRQEFFLVDASLRSAFSDPSVIPLETIYLEEKNNMSRVTSGLEEISEKASGQIVIFNTYNSQPQVLVRRTRFETPDGKIYRIAKSIRVPGAKVEGGEIKPSSIEVTVFADDAGEDYNIGLSDFTIPGFKGSDKYDKIYARSKTPMSGGFRGTAQVVSADDIKTLESDLKSNLSENLLGRVKTQLPEGFIIPVDAFRVVVKESNFSAKTGERADTLNAGMTISFEGFAIRYSEIEKSLNERYLTSESEGAVQIVNLKDLNYILEDINFDNKSMVLNVKGQVHAAWVVDKDSLISDLLVAKRGQRMEVFSRYSAIKDAKIVYSPSWWPFFPDQKEKVNINMTFIQFFQ